MSFIGVIALRKCKIDVEKILYDNLKDTKHTIIMINRENVDNIKNVKFETVLLIGEITKGVDKYKRIIANAKYLIINLDIEENLSLLEDLDLSVITYGFNLKSTITASSTEDTIISLQRSIKDVNSIVFDPQEIKVDINKMTKETYTIMGIVGVLLIYVGNKISINL